MQVLTEEQNLTDIANAIRYKKNAPDEKYSPGSMANAIMSIPTEGGGGGGGGLIPIETRELALNFAPPPEGAIVDRLDWNAPSGYGYKNVFIKRPESLRQDTVKAGEVIFGIVGTYKGSGSGGGDIPKPIDPVQYRTENRNPNYPYIPLPSEMDNTMDTIYVLYDATGLYCCPVIPVVCSSPINVEIMKYNNTQYISSEIMTINSTTKYLTYDENTDADYNTYNYIVLKLQGIRNSISAFYLKKGYKYRNIIQHVAEFSIEFSANCENCILRNNIVNDNNNRFTSLEYFSALGCKLWMPSHVIDCENFFLSSPLVSIAEIDENCFYGNCTQLFSKSKLVALPKNVSIFKNVTNANWMFDSTPIETIMEYDFSSVLTASNMFAGCENLLELRISLPNATNCVGLANGTSNLINIECDIPTAESINSLLSKSGIQTVKYINAGNAINLLSVFSDCVKLKSVKEFKYSNNVTSFKEMFKGCTQLEDVGDIFLQENSVNTTESMFYQCKKLKKIPKMNLDYVVNTSNMFYLCSNLYEGELSIPMATNLTSMFRSCEKLFSLSLNQPSAAIMTECFYNCLNLKNLMLNSTTKVQYFNYTFYNCNLSGDCNLKTSVTFESASDCSYMFNGSSIKEIPDIIGSKYLINFQRGLQAVTKNKNIPMMKNIGNLDFAFSGNSYLENIEVDFSGAQIIDYAFYQNQNIKNVKIKIKGTTSSTSLFYEAKNLEVVDFDYFEDKSFNPSKMRYSLSGCYSLKKLIIREFGEKHVLTLSIGTCYHFRGIKDSTYNPTGAKDGRIYVPDNIVSTLKAEDGWKDYADIILPLSSYVES